MEKLQYDRDNESHPLQNQRGSCYNIFDMYLASLIVPYFNSGLHFKIPMFELILSGRSLQNSCQPNIIEADTFSPLVDEIIHIPAPDPTPHGS